MERNFEKELAIALDMLSAATAENIALRSLLDDLSATIDEQDQQKSK